MLGLALLLASAAFGPEPALYQPQSAPAVMILAEGDEEVDPDAKPKPKRKVAKKPPVAAEKLTTPSAPIPYAAPADAAAAPTPVLKPAPVTSSPMPQMSAVPAPPAPPAPPPVPDSLPYPAPPPERVYIYPLLDQSVPKEISLRCETLVFAPDGTSTRGIVRLSLIPSLVNPDEFADVHVMSVDIGHASIIRNTACEAYRCSVSVTPGFYALTVMDRKKSEIKITLNRQTGAFFGYEKQSETTAHGLIMLKKGVVTNENGWCVPEAPGKALF